MAAYAALVSLMYVVKQIENHPFPPISLDKQQVESLTEKIGFLQHFLETYTNIGDDLESRVADAAYAAEDMIETHIVDQIHSGFTKVDLYGDLQRVINDMDSIKRQVEKMGGVGDKLPIIPMRTSSAFTGERAMVDFGDVLIELMDKLTRGQPELQIFSIVGMGGSGKTTLARNIYENQLVVEHFHVLAWATISQVYNVEQILIDILVCLNGNGSRGGLSEMKEDKLGELLYKSLCGRTYLIILDDIWEIQLWDRISFFFPNNNAASRIVMTTRISKLASLVSSSHNVFTMKFFDEDKSWDLFCKIVFGKEDCPRELEKSGKRIVKNCGGLPLSISVIGGLLAKSKQTEQHWQVIVENLNSIVNSKEYERCLQILYTSYSSLQVHLKPCFLYLGVCVEFGKISASSIIIRLWVGEGFIKPICGKSLEEAAEDYLKELVDRNLIWGVKGSYGKVKECGIHDLLRDLCLRESKKNNFFCVLRKRSVNIPQGINTQRRIYILKEKKEYAPQVIAALGSLSHLRSLRKWEHENPPKLSFISSRLLRVVSTPFISFPLEDIFQLLNLRIIEASIPEDESRIPSSISLMWNLQTLILDSVDYLVTAPPEIWKMAQLKHVSVSSLCLPDPQTDDIVLENLQTLSEVNNFKCGEEVLKRICNVSKLGISYTRGSSYYFLENLDRLDKLKSLICNSFTSASRFLERLTFPRSLKKLTLGGDDIQWEDMLEKIGRLPLLEKLKLICGCFKGRKWETVEGQFRRLKVLKIEICSDLQWWITESSHFPLLERLVLHEVLELEEIPSSIGDIPTLQYIGVYNCSDSALDSAKRIQEEQEDLDNVGLIFEFRDPSWFR